MGGGWMQTSVVLADDEGLLRRSLATVLALEEDIVVIGEAATGEESVELVLEIRPDVFVVAAEMHEMNGIDVAKAVLECNPTQIVLLLTRHARPRSLHRALSVGVRGILSKAAEPVQLTAVIRALSRGRRWIDPEFSALAVVDDCPLTARELDVLKETSHGYSVADIAERLHLAEGTVRNYLSHAMQKMHSPTRHDAARRAREHEWL